MPVVNLHDIHESYLMHNMHVASIDVALATDTLASQSKRMQS